jgi:sec-independent protein translocase protein TatA
MGELSPWHWIIVLLLFALLFGSKRLPDAARGLGRSLRIFRAEMQSANAEAPATPTPPVPPTPAPPTPAPADEVPVDAIPTDTVPVDAIPPQPEAIPPVLRPVTVADQVPLPAEH